MFLSVEIFMFTSIILFTDTSDKTIKKTHRKRDTSLSNFI